MSPPLGPLLEALALLVGIGASAGFFVWALLNSPLLSTHLDTNTLEIGARRLMLLSMTIGGVTTLALAWVLWVERQGSIDRLRRVATRLSPVLTLGLVPLIFEWRVWESQPLQGLLLILATCVGLERAVRASLEVGPCLLSREAAERVDRARASVVASPIATWAPLALVAVCAAAYAVFFSAFSLHNHYRLATAAFDLGIENNLVWNAAHLNGPLFKTSPLGGPTAVHSGYHQTFISYLIAIPYRLWPTPQALLVLQASVIAAASFPLYVWVKARAGAWPAAFVAIAYLFYPPVHGGNLYDFHYQPFGPLFVFITLICFERGWWKRAVLFAFLTLCVREDMSLMLAVLGAFLMLTRKRVVSGLILVMVCSVVFVVQKMIVMPMLLGGQAYIHQYSKLIGPGDSGFGGVLKTVFSNPGFTLGTLLKMDKFIYALQIFVPLVLLPLRRPIGWVLCLPGFFFTFLSTEYPPLVSIAFQYTAYWSMFVFLACGWVLGAAGPIRRKAMVVALIVATAATTWNFGGWLRSDSVAGGFGRHHFDLTEEDHRRHKDVYFLIDQIPPDVKVAATEYLNAHVSSRANAYALRDGPFDAEWFLFEQPRLTANERAAIAQLVEKNEVGVVASRGGFYLLRKGADTARNAELLPLVR